MQFSIRNVALIALSLTTYATAGPVVQQRDVQERGIEERATTVPTLPLIVNINALTAAINTAQSAVGGLSTLGGVTITQVGNVAGGLGNIVNGINTVIGSAVTTTGGITAAEYNQLQAAFGALAVAFTKYITSLRLAALTASVVYTADDAANTAVATSNLVAAAANQAVGSTLGTATGVVNGIVIPATNAAIVASLKSVACLTDAANSLLTPLTASVNSVAAGRVTPVTGVTQVANGIPNAAAPLITGFKNALNVFLSAGLSVKFN